MTDIRTALAEFTGAQKVHTMAKMIDFDGPVGVEGYIDGNHVIGVYEGQDRVAFVMGTGSSGYIFPDGTFEYHKAATQRSAEHSIGLPPSSERTTEMIRQEIHSLFAQSNHIEVLDWCDPK